MDRDDRAPERHAEARLDLPQRRGQDEEQRDQREQDDRVERRGAQNRQRIAAGGGLQQVDARKRDGRRRRAGDCERKSILQAFAHQAEAFDEQRFPGGELGPRARQQARVLLLARSCSWTPPPSLVGVNQR